MITEENAKYLNLLENVVGKTVSTKEYPSTTAHFYFWVSREAKPPPPRM